MKLLEKFIDILISNIYSLIVTFCISASLLLTYMFCWKIPIVLCLFFFFAIPCLLNFIRRIKHRAKSKTNKDWLFNIYLNLDTKERDILYNLFYIDNYKVDRDASFYMDEGSLVRTKTFMGLVYYTQPGSIFSEENKEHYTIICHINDVYTNGTG